MNRQKSPKMPANGQLLLYIKSKCKFFYIYGW